MRYYFLLVLALSFAPQLCAENDNSVRLLYARSSESDFVTVVIGDYEASPEANYIIGANFGHELTERTLGLPITLSANVGLQHLSERGYQRDGLGVTAFIKAHYSWQLPWTGKHVRLGFGEGLSYVSRIPISEQRDFAAQGGHSRRLLNYLEWTVDVPLTQFTVFDSLLRGRVKEVSVGFTVWHRSTVFGLMGDIPGGINFMGVGFEAKY